MRATKGCRRRQFSVDEMRGEDDESGDDHQLTVVRSDSYIHRRRPRSSQMKTLNVRVSYTPISLRHSH